MDYLVLKKSGLVAVTLIALVSSISFVFGNFIVLGEDVKLEKILSKNIFLNSPELNKTTIIYSGLGDISNYTFTGACESATRYIGGGQDVSYFEITLPDTGCKNGNFYLEYNGKTYLNTEITLNLNTDADLYGILLDLHTQRLEKLLDEYDSKATKNSLFKEYDTGKIPENQSFWVKSRIYKESEYKKSIVQTILEKREYKYIVPVLGYPLPTQKSKVPNAGRPYRKDVTDAIHHSWDIDAPFGEEVIALDDAIIIRIVNNWAWNNLSNMRKSKLSSTDMDRNLDIFRGNQVWLKTMKGEVIMYAHLDTVVEGMQENTLVKKGTILGTIGISGVPQADYADYHLDFSVHENPYNEKMAGKYDIDDYMSWPWLLKGKSYDYIIEHQYDYFEQAK